MPEINLNSAPYFDDFDKEKNYQRILFRAELPVQARELTQSQSIQWNQLNELSSHIFKNGSRVHDGGITIINDVEVISVEIDTILAPINNQNTSPQMLATPIRLFKDLIVVGRTSGIKAKVIWAQDNTEGADFLYVQYMSGGIDPSTGENVYSFLNNEQIEARVEDNPAIIETYALVGASSQKASVAFLESGTYYVDGFFIRVQDQFLVLDTGEDSNTPSWQIGFNIQTKIITAQEDSTLYDNSAGYGSYGAPGANRLQKTLVLSKRPIGQSADQDFVEMIRVIDGEIQFTRDDYPQYAELMTMLARRHSDTSGDFVIKPFAASIQEKKDKTEFQISLAPSKAYVKGYEIQTFAPRRITVPKPLESAVRQNYRMQLSFGGWIHIPASQASTFLGWLPSIQNNSIVLNKVEFDSSGNMTDVPVQVGIAKIRCVETLTDGSLKVFLFDVQFVTKMLAEGIEYTMGEGVTQNETYGYIAYADRIFDSSDPDYFNTYLYVTDTVGTFAYQQNQIEHIRYGINEEQRQIRSCVSYTAADLVCISPFLLVQTDYNNSRSAPFSLEPDQDPYIVLTVNEAGGTLNGGMPELIYDTGKSIKTFRKPDGSAILDNDFNILIKNPTTTSAILPNETSLYNFGDFKECRVDDGPELKKTLRYKLKSMPASGSYTAGAYGTRSIDREIALDIDLHNVIEVLESSSNTSPSGHLLNFIPTTPVQLNPTFPIGAKITGSISGATAWVLQAPVGDTIEVVRVEGVFLPSEDVTFTDKNVVYTRTLKSSEWFVESSARSIRHYFEMDTGQRIDHYNMGRLIRKSWMPRPLNALKILYSYFTIDAQDGYYFSADSYSSLDLYDYDIRFFNAKQSLDPLSSKTAVAGIDLRNCIDFRQRMESVAPTVTPFMVLYRTFNPSILPAPVTRMTSDIEFYLPRKDRIFLTKEGEFVYQKGLPSDIPEYPTLMEDAMLLNDVSIAPICRYLDQDIALTTVPNKRYQMSDIKKLEDRIETLEDTVELSLLERDARDMFIPLPSPNVPVNTPFDSFKTGFVVDSFWHDTKLADFSASSFNAFIDTGAMTAPFTLNDIDLEVESLQNCVVKNGRVFLSYNEIPGYVSQPKGTDLTKINPSGTWDWSSAGKLVLEQWEDFSESQQYENPYTKAVIDPPSDTIFSYLNSLVTEKWVRAGRPIVFSASGLKPSTVYKLYIDSVEISDLAAQYFDNDALSPLSSFSDPLISSSTGKLKGVIRIPANTFESGARIFELSDGLSSVFTIYNTTSILEKTIIDPIIKSETELASEKFLQYIPSPSVLPGIAETFTVPYDCFMTNVKLWFFAIDGDERYKTYSELEALASKFGLSLPVYSANQMGIQVLQEQCMLNYVTLITAGTISRTTFPTAESFTDYMTKKWTETVSVGAPVFVEIREVRNGLPSNDVLVGSFVTLEPGSRQLPFKNNKQYADVNGVVGSVAEFDFPVYLSKYKEYALYVSSPSAKVTLWTAYMGHTTKDTGEMVSTQPYLGKFFSFKNGIWAEETYRDLKFSFSRAEFTSTAGGVLNLINVKSDNWRNIGKLQAGNPLYTAPSDQPSKVMVYHPFHGMYYPFYNKVRFKSDSSFSLNSTSDNLNSNYFFSDATTGLPKALPLVESGTDWYTISLDGVFSQGSAGSTSLSATQNIQYDAIRFLTPVFEPMGTATEIRYKGMTGTSPSTNDVPFIPDSLETPVSRDSFYYPIYPKIVPSRVNLDSPSIWFKVVMQTQTSMLSPVVDLRNMNKAVLRQNMIDKGTIIEEGTTPLLDTVAYITKEVSVQVPSKYITISFDAKINPRNAVKIFYKYSSLRDTTPISSLGWIFAYLIDDSTFELVEGDVFVPYTFHIGASEEDAIPEEFDAYQIAITLSSDNECEIPVIKNLKVITTADVPAELSLF